MLAKYYPPHPNYRWVWFWKDTALIGLILSAEYNGDKFKKEKHLRIIALN